MDFARHIDLAHTHIGHGDVESRPRARPALDPRIHPPQTRHQHVPQLLERQVGNKNLPDLGNQDEPLSCHRKAVRQLDTAGEYEDQLVSRTKSVVRRDGTRERGEELGRGATEHVHPKHVVADREGLGRYRFAAGADEPRLRGQGIRGDRASQTQGLQHT